MLAICQKAEEHPWRIIAMIFAFVLVFSVLRVERVNGISDAFVVGVKTGDWVRYKVSLLGESNAAWDYQSLWVKVEVLNVSDTRVVIRETQHYSDGSESNMNWTGNFEYDKSIGNFNYLIAANLGPGDILTRSSMYFNTTSGGEVQVDVRLNTTVQRIYGWVEREVNRLLGSAFRYEPTGMGDYHAWINFTYMGYWDKASGLLLEYEHQEYPVDQADYYKTHQPSTFRLSVEDTNLWKIPEKEEPMLPLLAVSVGLAAGTVMVLQIPKFKKRHDQS
jgi:hypothetical protein